MLHGRNICEEISPQLLRVLKSSTLDGPGGLLKYCFGILRNVLRLFEQCSDLRGNGEQVDLGHFYASNHRKSTAPAQQDSLVSLCSAFLLLQFKVMRKA